jgi:hypothetical protein
MKKLIFLFLFLPISQNYIILKLQKYHDLKTQEDYSPQVFINDTFGKYYTLLNIGSPPQLTEVDLVNDLVDLFLSEQDCLTSNYYDKNKSLSLVQTHVHDPKNPFDVAKVFANDSIKFINYNKSNKEEREVPIKQYTFLYKHENKSEKTINKKKPGKACGKFGLKIMCPSNSVYCQTFLDMLKINNLINYKNFFFGFVGGGDNFNIIIGEKPYEYDKENYNPNYYYKSRAEISDSTGLPEWKMNFQNYFYLSNGTRISFNLTKIKEYMQVIFTFDLEYIVGIMEYLYEIKIHYFNKYKNKCQENIINRRYTVITCNKNFDTKDFPTIYFENIEANYTLQLTHEDLFKVIGDKKYFLIIFDKYSIVPWKVGKIFLKKYFFNFEAENKMIGFYLPKNWTKPDESKEKENSDLGKKNYYWMLWILLTIFTGIGCFFIGKCFVDKKRKKRANEMTDDDYEYEVSINEKVIYKEIKGMDHI